jgi:hypothetical protein
MQLFWSRRLNIELEILNFIFDTFKIYEQRARTGEFKKIVFEVRTKEKGHNRPHIHASYNYQYEISISIDEKIEVIAGNIPIKQQTIALKWVEQNIKILRNEWNNYHIDKKIPMISSALNFHD